MATVNVTKDTFDATIASGIVLLDWWANWCMPCRAFVPVFERASRKHSDVIFGKIDTDVEKELSDSLGVRSIPTIMMFRDGILVYQQPGMMPAPVLEKLIRKVRALDMDAVRKKLDEAEACNNAHR